MGKNKVIPQVEELNSEESALLMQVEKEQAEQENIRLEEEKLALQALQIKKNQNKERKAKVKGMLDGSILLKEGLIDHWRFILFCFGLAVLLIASNYFAESTARKISSLKKEMKEFRTIEVSTKAELMSVSIQSSVAVALDTLGLKESIVPPIKIIVPKTDKDNDTR